MVCSRRQEKVHLSAQDLLTRVAEDALRRIVPERDLSLPVYHDDGVLRRCSQALEFFLAVPEGQFRLAALSPLPRDLQRPVHGRNQPGETAFQDIICGAPLERLYREVLSYRTG